MARAYHKLLHKKNNTKIAIFSVLNDNTKKYLNSFFKSLKEQTYNDFQLFIYDDCTYKVNFQKYINFLNREPIIFYNNSIKKYNKNRIFLINKIFDLDYKKIIFCDTDDLFSKNRFEKTIFSLNSNQIVFNQIKPFKNKKSFKNKNLIKFDKTYVKFKDNLYGNNIGFGNSAIQLNKKIIKIFNTIPNILTHDWYFYNYLLAIGYKAKFINNALTYYRIHNSSLSSNISKKSKFNFTKTLNIHIYLYNHLVRELKGSNYKSHLNIKKIEKHLLFVKSLKNIYPFPFNEKDYVWWGIK